MRSMTPDIAPAGASFIMTLSALLLCCSIPEVALGETSADKPDPTLETAPAASSSVSDSHPIDADEADASQDRRAGAGGLWIFLDPDTGERLATPTPEQAAHRRAWAAALNKSDLGLEAFELEQGGRGVYLNGRFRHALKATLLPDGSFGYRCSDHPGEFLAGRPGELLAIGPADGHAAPPATAPEQ